MTKKEIAIWTVWGLALVVVGMMALCTLTLQGCATMPATQQARAQTPQQTYQLTTRLELDKIYRDLRTMPVDDLIRLLVYDHTVRLTNRTNQGQVGLTNIVGPRLVPTKYLKKAEPAPEVPREAPKTEEKVQ